MKKTLILISCISAITACSVQKTSKTGENKIGDTRTTKVVSLDDDTYKLSEQSDDQTYGYDQKNPIKVGGKDGSGPKNERRFLNALTGPGGEPVKYYRRGSCCSFKTPNGFIDNMGLLDRYAVYWEGGQDTMTLYLNMYDNGDLKIPVNFKAKSQ